MASHMSVRFDVVCDQSLCVGTALPVRRTVIVGVEVREMDLVEGDEGLLFMPLDATMTGNVDANV